jgi:hypothetical protein
MCPPRHHHQPQTARTPAGVYGRAQCREGLHVVHGQGQLPDWSATWAFICAAVCDLTLSFNRQSGWSVQRGTTGLIIVCMSLHRSPHAGAALATTEVLRTLDALAQWREGRVSAGTPVLAGCIASTTHEEPHSCLTCHATALPRLALLPLTGGAPLVRSRAALGLSPGRQGPGPGCYF